MTIEWHSSVRAHYKILDNEAHNEDEQFATCMVHDDDQIAHVGEFTSRRRRVGVGEFVRW